MDGGWVGGLSKGWWRVVVAGGWLDGWVACQRVGGEW